MLVSEYFALDRTQATLDFLDVDVEGDIRAFVDPRALRRLPGEWAGGCVGLLQDFFSRVLAAVQAGDQETGLDLLIGLREPNETHLGFSRRRARGTALGPGLAELVWEALADSEAAQSGLLADLEDTALVVRGIETDRVSDITTNVIREPLIRYTQEMAEHYGIPVEQVGSGHVWDPIERAWQDESYTELPMTPTGRLLLIPKSIVRTRMDFDPGEYYRHYILETLRDIELHAGTALVHVLRSGQRRVYKKDVEAEYRRRMGSPKEINEKVTLEHPEILERYREDKDRQPLRQSILNFSQIGALTGAPPPDWPGLLRDVTGLATGSAQATAFHLKAEALLTALFYPDLTNPKIETEIHGGRKRIDIRYTNPQGEGFFSWMRENYPPQPFVYVECKNYSADLGNDALDQLSGRFSEQRGTVGLLVCRRYDDKPRFIERCRDTARDGRGFVITLDDSDLTALTNARARGGIDALVPLLQDRLFEVVG